MDEKYVRDRITELRIAKGVSEYKMSLDLGHSKSYIQSISSGRAMPSMSEFLYICDYLSVTPKDFFDENNHSPVLMESLCEKARKLSVDDLEMVLILMNRLGK